MWTVLLLLSREEAQVRSPIPFASGVHKQPNVGGRQGLIGNTYTFAHSLGIGKMMTMALAENGAHKVYIIGRREDKLKELEAKYPGYA